MARAKICAAITEGNIEAIRKIEPLVDLFEMRIDLVGEGWQDIALQIHKPWIATNRSTSEGGKWRGSTDKRFAQLLKAIELGAAMVDIELESEGAEEILPLVRQKSRCIISYHNWLATPPLSKLIKIVNRELALGAYACKVVTTARDLNDNIVVLMLIRRFPHNRLISFAMGMEGILSRVMSPLIGGYLTYASVTGDAKSAPGQMTAHAMRKIYRLIP